MFEKLKMILYIIILLVIFAVIFIKKIQCFWSLQGVCVIRPKFFIGNVWEIVTYKKSWGQLILQFYNEFKEKGVRYGGIYFFVKPTFVPLDPEIIKCILVHDFQSFANRGLYYNEEFEPISCNLFTVEDKKWKFLRTVLTPTFTSYQIRKTFQSFVGFTNDLNSVLLKYLEDRRPIDITDLVSRFTTGVTVKCLFGIDGYSMTNPKCKYFELGKKMSDLTWKKSATLVMAQILPKKICGMMGLRFTEIEVEEFFLNIVKDIKDIRENQEIFRDDFINFLLLRNKDIGQTENNNLPVTKNNYTQGLTLNDIAAQCFITFLGGYATTASVLKFSLYELAINQNVQIFLRNEMKMVLEKHEELTMEAISEMEYLDAVVSETLRKYPVFPVLLRTCNQTYRVPGTNVTLNKGTLVNIPVLGLHMDPKYHPNPKAFMPERFIKGNNNLIKDGTFLPFGTGPRMCIGYRFGILLIKIGLLAFIKNYEISLSEDTKTPVELSANSFFVSTKDKIWININKIVNK